MATKYIMPDGEHVPVPHEVVAQGPAAEQAFYDNQLARIKAEAEPGSN